MRSTRIICGLLFCLAAGFVAVAGCGEDEEVPIVGGPGVIAGLVQDTAAAPLNGVTVTAGGQTTTTAVDGRYTLNPVPAGTPVARFEGAGVVSNSVPITVTPGQTSEVNVTLLLVGRQVDVDMTAAANAADDRADNLNATVALQADSVLDATGNPVANARVLITTSLPKDANYAASFLQIVERSHSYNLGVELALDQDRAQWAATFW